MPFEKVVEAVVKERDMSRSPLFQVMFVLQNTPDKQPTRLGEVVLSEESFEITKAKFEIDISVTETAEGLHGTVEYCTDLYKEQTIQRMMGHFKELLNAAVTTPGFCIGLLPMLTEVETQQLLQDFNNNTSIYPASKTIVEIFEEQVEKFPGNIALEFEGQQLTYRQLNERANQLANYLQANGVQEESMVPVFMERSLEMMVAILGILKAGGAYVPIDPGYPADRFNFMLEDIAASIVLSSSESIGKLAGSKINILSIDSDWPNINQQPSSAISTTVSPDGLAYVIYTSGSTGKPKGVMVTQKNVVSLVKSVDYVSLTNETVLLSTGSSSFDATTLEYWGVLLNGGRLVLCPASTLADPALLKQTIDGRQVNMMWFTSSWFNQLVETGILLFENLQNVLVGGEKLSVHHIEKFRLTYPAIQLINGYGPTENTTFSLTYSIHETVFDQSIPIGRPLNNRSAFILDQNHQLVPVGVSGEICLSGDGLSRGYLNQTELTAEKFVPHPFSKIPGARIYKTGDIGCWLPDGNIAFQGRIDDQVKIRGYRIELGEIEHLLQQTELARQAVVMVKEEPDGDKYLVGYVVPVQAFDKEAILSYLRSVLPDYMVPAVWVELSALPLTANGKVNKKALPAPGASVVLAGEYVAPCNELETTLAATWQALLHKGRIGIHDNFFELGGHSLLAMRLISAIRKEQGIEIGIRTLFTHPTIAALANHIAGQHTLALLPAIGLQARPKFIPLSFSQERLWFIHQLEGTVQYHLPAVLRLKGDLNKAALIFALQQVIQRHEALRTVILAEEGQGYQQIREADQWQLTIDDSLLPADDIAAVKRHILQIINAPFDLSSDFMIRANLVSINKDEHLLVLVLHHIASDGWSRSVLVKEMVTFYNAHVEGCAASLAVLPIQYADYAIWQRTILQSTIHDQKLAYWKQKLEGVLHLQLPTDFARPAIQSTRGGSATFHISSEITSRLRSISRQQEATLFMTLLAAFNVLLYRYSGQTDICVGTPVAGRRQQEVEDLVGFFINTLVLRFDLSENPTFEALLQQIKDTTLDAYAHDYVPFEKVVDAVAKDRDMSRSPLFQVMLILQNTPEIPVFRLGELELSEELIENNTAKFELLLNLVETPAGLQGTLEYCTDLYQAGTIQKMIGHLEILLAAIAATPGERIGQLPMLTAPEQHQLLFDFNDAMADYPKDKTIVGLFEEQAASKPNNIALVFEQQQLTYRELNERANQLARYLQKKGVKEDTLVPICIERGIEMLVGLLAILKAGGAYVPVDPDYPADRISYMLEDTGAKIIVTSNESRVNMPVGIAADIISVDGDREVTSKEPDTNLPTLINPANLAYVIYTSGSTGKPKGVLIEHRNVVRLFETSTPIYDFTEKDTWCMFHSISFDFSVWEMYGALLYGGRLVIVPKQVTKDSALFADLLIEQQVTILNQTPSAFYVLQEQMVEKVNAVAIRYVIFGGEALNPAKLQPWKSRYPNSRLINMYGITETTVHVTFQEIGWEQVNGGKSVIGKPIPTLTAYILDSHQNLLPIGVAGELCIGGAGLARGYLNRPELTAERFISNPFNKEPCARLYRSGDSGMWLADGNIEYLGRIDEQVKIRGYRIELGEIESVLQDCEAVRQVVVLAKADKEDNKMLVGGEAVKEDIKTALISRGNVWNVYGPTETTIWSTIKRLEENETVQIGQPIANTTIRIVNREGQLVPAGLQGRY